MGGSLKSEAKAGDIGVIKQLEVYLCHEGKKAGPTMNHQTHLLPASVLVLPVDNSQNSSQILLTFSPVAPIMQLRAKATPVARRSSHCLGHSPCVYMQLTFIQGVIL